MRCAILALLLVALLCGQVRGGESRLGFGRIALDGNVTHVHLDFGTLGATTLTAKDGGRVFNGTTLRIPIPAAGQAGQLLSPTVECEGGGTVRYLGWDSAPVAVATVLGTRALPPASRELPRPSGLVLWGLAFAGFGVWLGLRSSRPALGLGLGALAALAILIWGARFVNVDGTRERVIDFAARDGVASSWLGVETVGAVERLDIGWSCQALEVQPRGARLELVMDLGDPGALGNLATEDRASIEVRGPRAARIWARRPWNGSESAWLRRTGDGGLVQSLGDLEAAWLRSAASEINALGAWTAEAAPGDAVPGAPGPPSWLVAGLPMGRAALLGQLKGSHSWVRVTWSGL
jgi:hypothetical protein